MSNLWFTEHYPPVYSIASNDSSQLYKNKTQKRKTYIYQLNSLPGPPRLGWGMPLLSLPWPLVEMLLAGGVQPPTCAEQYLPHRAISVITRTASMLEQEKNMTRRLVAVLLLLTASRPVVMANWATAFLNPTVVVQGVSSVDKCMSYVFVFCFCRAERSHWRQWSRLVGNVQWITG